jgi:hypothetical protein
MERMRTLAVWLVGIAIVLALGVVIWHVLPTEPRASGDPPSLKGGNSPLKGCRHIDGAEFSMAGGAGTATPEEAIATGVGFPSGTPTDGYVALPPADWGAITPAPVGYVHRSNGRVDALVQVVDAGAGWTVASAAHCT